MNTLLKKIGIGSAIAFAPFLAFAQVTVTLGDILANIGALISFATPIIVALALLYFFWGLAQYVLAAGSEEAKGEGRNKMIYGIIALFVMLSVWGLVQVLQNTFEVSPQDLTDIPTVPIPPAPPVSF